MSVPCSRRASRRPSPSFRKWRAPADCQKVSRKSKLLPIRRTNRLLSTWRLRNSPSLPLLDQKKNRFELTGPGYLTHEAGGYKFRVSHLSFFQVNRFLIEDLQKTVTANAHGELALDLYSGVGFFTLPLAKTFQKVVSVDANLAATRDLYANAEVAGVSIVSHNEHAEEFLKKTEEKPDFVILDPPRAGLGVEAAEKLAELGAKEIVYLSCDPSTLARDLAVLTGSSRKPKEITGPSIRYEITEMHLFDLL